MTDDEVYELAIKRADELSALWMDFLQYDDSQLIITYDKNDWAREEYTDPNTGQEYNDVFFAVTNENFKTYDDIFKIFNQTCTPDYSDTLLKYSYGTAYAEIDGKLYISDTILCRGPLESLGGEYISYEVVGDKIKLNFIVRTFYENVDYATEDEYSIFLENIESEWLISDCKHVFYSDGIYYHGYFWNSFFWDDYDFEYGIA
jgi:hypothetical protein